MSTQIQSQICSALQDLKFSPKDSKTMGGPQELEVTSATLDYLKGKTVTVSPDGSVSVSG